MMLINRASTVSVKCQATKATKKVRISRDPRPRRRRPRRGGGAMQP
jgi:hypothetical protein